MDKSSTRRGRSITDRRAERHKFGASYPSPPTLLDSAAAMNADDSIHNVFSSDRLWEQSSFFDPAEGQESSLFAPLQLDSKPSRAQHHADASC
jgi:hypothetical protein